MTDRRGTHLLLGRLGRPTLSGWLKHHSPLLLQATVYYITQK